MANPLNFQKHDVAYVFDDDRVIFTAISDQAVEITFHLTGHQLRSMANLADNEGKEALLMGFNDYHARIIAAAYQAWLRNGGGAGPYDILDDDIAKVAD